LHRGTYDPGVTSELHVSAECDRADLLLEVVRPDEQSPPVPAVVFFHGGGWREGDRREFLPHCFQVAQRGAVGVTVSFRLASADGGTSPVDCVDDAARALHWLHANAARLGIDAERICASGGSSGAQMAAAAVAQGAPAAALVLFSPGVTDDGSLRFRFLGDASPSYAPTGGFPPTLIVHGTDDEVVPIAAARLFRSALVAAGAPCELAELSGASHELYRAEHPDFERSFDELFRFLEQIGTLRPGTE
jgi:acetyl esterase/lipase